MLGTEWIPRIERVLRREGMAYRELVMVAWAMGEEGMKYQYAVEAYAEYLGCRPEWVHDAIMRRMEVKGLRCSPAYYLKWVVKEAIHAN